MNKEELWQLLVKRNPQFIAGPIAFTPASLRKFFDLVWSQARSSVATVGKSDLPDVLKDLLGDPPGSSL